MSGKDRKHLILNLLSYALSATGAQEVPVLEWRTWRNKL